MNKDLDERLLPNGEYRDAQNIEISTSEGSDVGSVQNVLGTVLKRGRLYDENTNILTEWSADSNLFDLINPTCIGSFVDTQNDNIYWFIHYSFLNNSKVIIKGSAVVQYDNNTDVIQPILVDINNILKFSSDYLITGINVIDGLLLWTDYQTEPKRINIKKFKEGTISGSDQFKVQTKYLGVNGSDFTEKDVTVIKISPNIKAELNLLSSKRGGAGTVNQPIILKSHSISFKTSSGNDGVSLAAGEKVTLTMPQVCNYEQNDILKLSFTESNEIEGDTKFEITVQIAEGTTNFQTFEVTILSIPDEVPFGIKAWEVVLSEEDPLFEKKFVRFSYRWKYIDGEYSTFAPFSHIAFLPSKFEYKSSDGFNVGMINNARQISIKTLEVPPVGVVEVDLLYKESNSTNVYVVDRIKTEDLLKEFPNGAYTIKSEIVGDVVESNQTLRAWDNVPLRAKSQEISSNRVLYGNYVQGYNIQNDRLPEISTTHNSTDILTVGLPEKSIKSQRTYQVGVVYLDAYSRETPVFSKKDATVTIGKDSANKVNSLSCSLSNNAPDFATHFKYFVKETSSEYYNLALDRYYLAEDGNIWLSFPSSERNKLSEEDYLILKKGHDNDTFVKDTAKYKVLDIESNAPSFISTELKSIATANDLKCVVGGGVLVNEPIANSVNFKFIGPTDNVNSSFYNSFSSNSEIVITTITAAETDIASTQRYRIKKGGPTGDKVGTEDEYMIYEITLRQAIKDIDKEVFGDYDNDGIISNSFFLNSAGNAAVKFKIEVLEKQKSNRAEFSGRFFAKINRDTTFDEHIIETFPAAETDFVSTRKTTILEIAGSTPNTNRSAKNTAESDFCWADTNVWRKFDTDFPRHPEQNSKEFTIYLAGVNAFGNGKGDHNNKYEDIISHPFSKEIRTTGTLIRFENRNGNLGSVYKIINCNVSTQFRSDKNSIKKRIAGRRRRFDVTIEKVNKDTTSKGLGYDDGFEYSVTDSKSITSRIDKIHVVRKLTSTDFADENDISSDNPAIFEIEPKESIDLDIYNEIGSALPVIKTGLKVTGTNIAANSTVTTHNSTKNKLKISNGTSGSISSGTVLTLTDPKGRYSFKLTTDGVISSGSSDITIAKFQVHGQSHKLDWSNCYSFGQGVESNRLRDDYNAVLIDKGPVVSTVLNEKYKQEKKVSSIIWSGIFNSTGGVNALNQFIQAEKITKDLNPEYGSIQKLHVRDTDLIALCEDKILRLLANKDALFNADGNTNLLSTNNVLGQAVPYSGEYGISKNPESFVSHAYRVYFSDKARGSILRLSKDGLTDIAMKGMTDWFNDNLPLSKSIVGSYNERKGSYNLTLNGYTVCFDERVDGWTSFKSFLPESGVSLNNIYYTYSSGYLYAHTSKRRNSFHQNISKVISTNSGDSKIVNISSQPSVVNISVGDFLLSPSVTDDITVTSIVVPYVSVATVNGSISSTTSVAVDGNSGTISVGDIVTGSGIATNIVVKVASLTNQNNIVLDTALSLSNETALSFTGTTPNKTLNTVVTFSSAPGLSNSSNIEFVKTHESSVDLLINDEPSLIKEYKTLSYEGSKSKAYTYSGTISVNAAGGALNPNVVIPAKTTLDQLKKLNYNSNQIAQLTETVSSGWSSTSIITDSQSGSVRSFKEKEGLWSNSISGDTTSLSNIDTKELSVQGLGYFNTISGSTSPTQSELKIVLANSTSSHNTGISATKTINGVANGANINSTYGTLDLIINATTGYSLIASRFAFSSAAGVSGAGVSSVSFTQDGINVKATITFSGVMPSSDDTMTITITGAAIANTYTLNGFYDTIELNTTEGSSDDIVYSGSGVYDKKTVSNANTDPITYARVPETVFTKTFTADPVHFFFTKPVAFIEEEDSSSISSYTITDNWATATATVDGAVSNSATVTLDAGHSGITTSMAVTGLGLGQNTKVSAISSNTLTLSSAKTIPDGTTLIFTSTVVLFNVKYIYGINNPKFDKIVFTAKAIEVFDPGITELTSFISGNKTVLSSGETRTMLIQGSNGYEDETNATFTFSNEASGTAGISFSQTSGTTSATLTFTSYIGTVRAGMSVTGTNIPPNTFVNYVVVDSSTGVTTIHLTLPSVNSISTPTGVILFKEYYNNATLSFQAASYTITLPEVGSLSIKKVYNPTTIANYYKYFIRAIAPSDLSSGFLGDAVLDSSLDFASCTINQYERPDVKIVATSNLKDNQDPQVDINIRNLDDVVAVASNGGQADSKSITIAAGNTEIKAGMLVTGTNILAKTRVRSIDGTTLTIDKTPTTAPTGELKFIDNRKFEAYGDPDDNSTYGKMPFKVVASVGGSSILSKQREISVEEDFQYYEMQEGISVAAVVSGNIGFSSGSVPDSIAVGSIITSDRIAANHSDKVITVGAIPSTSAITLAVNGVTLSTGASTYASVNDVVSFSPPYSWDFSISDLVDSFSSDNKKYILSGILSINRYGYQSLPIGLNLNNILQATSDAGGESGGQTTTYVFVQKTSSVDYYISRLVMYPKTIAVGTATSVAISFSGTVTGNWYGNSMSGIRLYLGPGTTGFKNSAGQNLVTGSSSSASVLVSLTSSLTTANSNPTATSATFSFTLKLAATAAAGQSLIVEPRIYLPIEP